MSYIQTRSGRAFDFEDPDPDSICLEDITHAMARINRFTGHADVPCSVAVHSIGVGMIVKDRGCSHEVYVAALLHDAAEAYVGDVSAPLKRLIPDYARYEDNAARAICAKFGVDRYMLRHPYVKQADYDASVTERDLLLGGDAHPDRGGWRCGEPHAMYECFLENNLGLVDPMVPPIHPNIVAANLRELITSGLRRLHHGTR